MHNSLSAFKRLLQERPHFRHLWLSTVVSQIGNWLSYIAVSLLSLQQGEGAIAVALVLISYHLPHSLFAPIAGPLADRFDRRQLMVLANLLAALLTLGMWAAACWEKLFLLQFMLFLRVSLDSIVYAARGASLPKLVERRELHQANTLLSLSWSLLFAAGVALGGFLAALFSPKVTILIDAATFILAGLILLKLPALPIPLEQRSALKPSELFKALSYARRKRVLMVALLGKLPVAMVGGAAWLSLNLMVGERFSFWEKASALGLLHGVRALGTGVGPLLSQKLFPPKSSTSVPWLFIAVLLFALFEDPLLMILSTLLWGLAGGHNWVATNSLLQSKAPDHLLGRFSALDFLVFTLGTSSVVLSGAFLVDHFQDPRLPIFLGLLLATPAWLLLSWLEKKTL